jgi:hypothetical protein
MKQKTKEQLQGVIQERGIEKAARRLGQMLFSNDSEEAIITLRDGEVFVDNNRLTALAEQSFANLGSTAPDQVIAVATLMLESLKGALESIEPASEDS